MSVGLSLWCNTTTRIHKGCGDYLRQSRRQRMPCLHPHKIDTSINACHAHRSCRHEPNGSCRLFFSDKEYVCTHTCMINGDGRVCAISEHRDVDYVEKIQGATLTSQDVIPHVKQPFTRTLVTCIHACLPAPLVIRAGSRCSLPFGTDV